MNMHRRGSVTQSGKNSDHGNERHNRRRITQVDPNVQISEIVSIPTRTHANRKKLNRSELYHFECEGDLKVSGSDDKLHVKWDAKFDRPIEQLIYPSLQRFDNESFEKKRQQYRNLHGSNNEFVAHVSRSIGEPGHVPDHFYEGLQLDFIKGGDEVQDNILFLYPPKWNVQLAKVPLPGDDDNEHKNEEIISVPASPSKSVGESEHASVISDLRSRRSGRSIRSKISYEDMEDTYTIQYMPLTSSKKYGSAIEEIDAEGEKFLRRKIKDTFKKKVDADEQALREQAEQKNPFNVAIIRAKKLAPANLPPVLDAGDKLYASLKTRRSMDGLASKPVKLSDLSPEEIAYREQLKYLNRHIPKEDEYLLDGLLYYRMHGQIHAAEMEEKKALDEKKMSAFRKKVVATKKFSSGFQQRVSNRRHALASNVQEMHALKNEEANMVTAEDLESLPPIEEINLGRTTRAYKSLLTGVHATIDSEVKREENLQKTLRYTIEDMQQAERNKRIAQDKLLLNQLDAGVLPEQFIKPGTDPLSVTVMLTKHSIGDVRGICLGKCFAALDRLEAVGLSDNRLTAMSLPTIIENLNPYSVKFVDLSFNEMFDKGAKALANVFKANGNVLRYLDLCNTGIRCEDVKVICNNLKVLPNFLDELYLAGNRIAADGAVELCSYLSSRTCVLEVLDLSWNSIGERGAMEFANALRSNKSLKKINLSANGLNDIGGQRLSDSIPDHTTIEEINLSQNGLKDGTCFVLSQVLQGHPSIRKMELNLNPLGEAGARSIFRTILRGLKCFVTMRDCSYPEDENIYNHQFPSSQNPFLLDLSEPYKRAVLQELLFKLSHDQKNCFFENVSYRENPKSPEQSLQFGVVNNATTGNSYVVLKGTSERYIPPKTGIIKCTFRQEMSVPTLDLRISDQGFNVLQIIIENGRTENDKKMWLRLLCQDSYFTTVQINQMITRFKKSNTIGEGGLTTLDIFKSTWKGILDTENMFDFLFQHTDKHQRKDLAYAMSIVRYKFNWSNPTSFWRLNLNDKVQRSIMLQLIAINNSESDFSKNHSGRQDTSQNGNWYNFRNERYVVNGQSTPDFVIDKEFLRNLPTIGSLEFDYVSTSRPPPSMFAEQLKAMKEAQDALNARASRAGSASSAKSKDELQGSSRLGENEISSSAAGSESGTESQGPSRPSTSHTGGVTTRPGTSHGGASNIPVSPLVRKVKLITEEDFREMIETLGLSSRTKVSIDQAMFILMDLQLAVTKFYFTTEFVGRLLDTFEDHWELQSRVIVSIFSRIYDLHNMDLIMRNLDTRAQKELLRRLGCLNVMNPLKISSDYVFNLRYLDFRILLVALMELASIESADNIIEDSTTELPISTLYGSYTRALNESRPETMKFTYCDFGVRTKSVSWPQRRELLKKFLVGTHPVDESMYKVISWYKEMDAAGALTQGPIDMQYNSYLKSLKNNATRVAKNNKHMVSMMRSAKKTG